jgi:hypothetical protein
MLCHCEHWSNHGDEEYMNDPDGVVKYGLALDLKTNKWIQTQSLTDEALDSVLCRQEDNEGCWIPSLLIIAVAIYWLFTIMMGS